jgi:ABC-type multidrug transport system ATPase subunit
MHAPWRAIVEFIASEQSAARIRPAGDQPLPVDEGRRSDPLLRFVLSDSNQWQIDHKDRVGVLSVGQTQKVAILLAVAHEPDLLVLDEPAASLDPEARRQFLQLIIDLPDPGRRTVLLSTHITSDLERIADRVAMMRGGQIVYSGLLEDLKDRTHLNLEDAYLEMSHA